MSYKDLAFELSGGELELSVYWEYSLEPGRFYGPPENCYPDEEYVEVQTPDDLEAQVRAFAETMIPIWIKEIEDKCMDMVDKNLPKEWAND